MKKKYEKENIFIFLFAASIYFNDDIYDEAVDCFSNNENYTYNYSLGVKTSPIKTGEISEFGNYDHAKLTEIFEYA